ncbi:hypothetical protein [Bacillus sp. FJAT-22090]|uniref:hypothetical protein n=1 Tax=Bacillus sp. FJAT-22090 TaxID=1581038 RepID=UPI0011A25914|nr:hypothetical protein [Bacillus sp. FJAT-22090]
MEKALRFNSEIQSIEKINPLFSRATIRVLYTGHNRNGSYFSKESVESSIGSIYNIPIIGEYIEETDNFGGHGASIEFKDNDIKLVYSTKPYGVVPESAQVYWENVKESDGTINEYLTIDGAYLWTGRYSELNTLLEEEKFNQSMEIEIIDGSFSKIDNIETFRVDNFLFSALCILGIDKDGEGHVEPAFESAQITTYSLDKEGFKSQFNQMIAELKFSIKEGGTKMEDNKTNIKQEETTETVEQDFDLLDSSDTLEQPETNLDKVTEDLEKDEEQSDSSSKDAPDSTEDATEQSEEESTKDIAINESEEEALAKRDSIAVGENAEPKDEEDAKEDEPTDFEAKYNDLQEQFTQLQSQLDELSTYKRQREELDIKAKFTDKLSEEEFAQVFESMKDADIQDVEDKLFALYGKKNFSISSTKSDTQVNKVKLAVSQVEDSTSSPYDMLFEKFKK